MYSLRHDLESDWTQQLEDMNIYDDVSFIYTAPGIEGDTLLGNIVLCFTVLAYDNKSKFLEPHKDRWENKKKIMITLAGLSCMTIPLFVKVIDNGHKESFDLSKWYIEYQKDWRWKDIVSCMEYHSMAIQMSNKGAIDAQEAVHIGKMKEISRRERKTGDEMMDELRTEFLNLDTVLEKEDREKVTELESTNFMHFESWLAAKQKKLADAKTT